MIVALIILAALFGVGLILFILDLRTSAAKAAEETQTTKETPQCCGLHLTCEKQSLSVTVDEPVEYYDDEELDVYKGIPGDSYDEKAIEQFREVLVTLMPGDIAGWARSIQMRGIELPEPIRDELLMIVAESRQ